MVKRRRLAGVAGGRDRRREAGYNLVILMVAVTVMNIAVAAAIPLWRTAIKREKEEELIFRGFQYAEGIRTFQRRFGRQPVRLEELIEVKPRCMRKLWVDPMTGKRDWVPVRVVMPGAVDPNAPPGGKPDPDDADGRPEDEPEGGGGGFGTPDGGAGLGPIRGVRSRSRDESIKTLFNQNRYDQWQFTVEVVMETAGPPTGFGVPGGGLLGTRQPARFLGRPFRPGLQALPMPGAPPPPPGVPPPAPPTGNKPPVPPQGDEG